MGIPDQPINLSGLSQLETAVICYYMQTLPIVSSNNSKLSTLKVKRYRPENAVSVGGSELDEELIEWTALPSDQCIHSVDWSCLKDTALSTLELHGVFDRSDDGSYINPDWLDTLLSKQQPQSISLQYICTDGQVEGEQAAYSYSD